MIHENMVEKSSSKNAFKKIDIIVTQQGHICVLLCQYIDLGNGLDIENECQT